MGKSPTEIVEEIADSGCSVKEAIDTLERARKIVDDIRAFMVKRGEGSSLKGAIHQRETLMEELWISIGGKGGNSNPSPEVRGFDRNKIRKIVKEGIEELPVVISTIITWELVKWLF